MELGGNAPFVVFDDADLDAAVDGAMLAKMRNIGEACTAANRFHRPRESVADEFSRRLAERMGALKVGRGTEDGVDVGPLVEAKQRDKVAELVDDAVENGARGRGRRQRRAGAATSTRRRCSPTCRPTRGCSARRSSARSRRSSRSTTEDEAIAMANDTEFGLVAYVFTRDSAARDPGQRAARDRHGRAQPGVVSNPAAPFGGVKHSGFGREGGSEGIEEYLETKYVGLAL